VQNQSFDISKSQHPIRVQLIIPRKVAKKKAAKSRFHVSDLSRSTCDGKVKDIYKSKELWRGPESIYRKEVVLALSGDSTAIWKLTSNSIECLKSIPTFHIESIDPVINIDRSSLDSAIEGQFVESHCKLS
jgi:hypothetical protein